MTRNRSSRGRRRNRDRSNAPGAAEAPQQEQQAVAEAAPAPEASSEPAQQAAPRPERRNRRPDRGPQARREDQSREGGQQRGPRPQGERREEGRPGGGAGRERSGRRRQGRARQQIQTVSGEILKTRVQVTGDRSPVHKRQMSEIDTPDGPRLGCPMLSRTRLGMPFKGGNHAPRCALAWALHSETEASYCMETHDLTQCWKAHPERLEEIRQRLAERAAD